MLSCLIVLTVMATTLEAQRQPADQRPIRWRTTLRADAIIDRDPGAQLGLGLAIPAAYNVRLGVEAGAGGVQRRGGWSPIGRVDLLGRWLSDPFRQSRWAIHAGGGVGVLLEEQRAPRPVAIVTLGVDGPSDGAWVPGVEVGLGGGVRAGLTLRRASRRSR
ncbi:MAG: hypothetical protein U5K74_07860 [Gemmatimonadaceae bacterium]|nr:hypothetical protein [Gemmatimonadaceae bacterium]